MGTGLGTGLAQGLAPVLGLGLVLGLDLGLQRRDAAAATELATVVMGDAIDLGAADGVRFGALGFGREWGESKAGEA